MALAEERSSPSAVIGPRERAALAREGSHEIESEAGACE
jgi:hypothetical protein